MNNADLITQGKLISDNLKYILVTNNLISCHTKGLSDNKI